MSKPPATPPNLLTPPNPLAAFESKLIAEARRQHGIISRGVDTIYPEAGNTKAENADGLLLKLCESLKNGTPLKIKFGMDPTAPDIHLGHTVPLTILRRFQDLGHIAQLLIGSYTARIGDPSGRNKTRPPLSGEEIDANAKTYLAQAFKVLKNDPKVLEVLDNGQWLGKLTFAETISLAAQVTVAQITQREDFAKRLAENTPISLHELLYPLMQGYDSVAMQCDIELGGTDQTFNCLMGRQLMNSPLNAGGKAPQAVITLPLLEGTDGIEKMSKSKKNYVGVTDAPADMFGKVMSIPDAIMPRWFNLLTDCAPNQRPAHPMEAKKLLGRILVTRFHDESAAHAAQADFETRFSKNEIPQDVAEVAKPLPAGGVGLLSLMVDLGFAESTSAARRLVQQGAVKKDGTPLPDAAHTFTAAETFVLQAGKRNMARVTLRQAL